MATQTSFEKKSLKLLIIDDSNDDAVLIADTLYEGGYDVHWTAVDTKERLKEELNRQWDIVLSDYNMPSMNGLDALGMVMAQSPDLPFVFVSGTIGEEAVAFSMRSGARDYVMKKDISRLIPTINRILADELERRKARENMQLLQRVNTAVVQAAAGICIADAEGKVIYVNPVVERQSTQNAQNLVGVSLEELFHRQDIVSTVKRGETFRQTAYLSDKIGTVYEELTVSPLYADDGAMNGMVATSRDVTERVIAEQAKNRLASVVEATPDAIVLFRPDGKITYLNVTAKQLLGKKEGVGGHLENSRCTPALLDKFTNEILPAVLDKGSWKGEFEFTISADHSIPMSVVALAHRDLQGSVEFVSVIARDISERRHYEDELQYKATHDGLTGLPNRYLMVEKFNAAVHYAKRNGKSVAVLFLDLNNFKRVNDTLGHAAGDFLIQQIAQRLKSNLRPSDTVARHGGDEFTVVISDLAHDESVITVLKKILHAFEVPVVVDGKEVYATFSTGIAMYPRDSERVEDLLRYADSAMYSAKAAGSNQFKFYAPDMDAKGQQILSLDALLRKAQERGEFTLIYQPLYNLTSGCIVGVEALIRWKHPEKGLVPPSEFIPLLESNGQIIDVGEWVIREGCKAHLDWRKLGLADLRMNINVSALQFNDKHFTKKVRKAVRDFQMPRESLELEITENMVIQNPESAALILQGLLGEGVRTAIDDFGTGYSSLANLKKLPLKALKIDKSFVSGLALSEGDSAIVEASISLAKKLGMQAVAEGVETATQMDMLRRHECDIVQGFYIGKPMESDRLVNLLQQQANLRNRGPIH